MPPFSQEVEAKNKESIKKMVLGHFGLDEESKERFVKLLYGPEFDEIYSPILGEDLRARFPVDRSLLESADEAWIIFKRSFATYVKDFSLTYNDFMDGRVRHNKNILRIFKHLPAYYFKDERSVSALRYDMDIHFDSIETVRQIFEERVGDIISKRLPVKKPYEIVISRNFADFFLCSTEESWSSCLNLESDWSGVYWAGLPGFITDKNKAMVYITDGDKKEYHGVITDRFLTRSFLTVTKNKEIKALRWYPQKEFFRSGVFNSLPFELTMFDPYEDKVMHAIEPLFYENGWSCFAYQDKTVFKYFSIEDTPFLPREVVSVEKGGQTFIGKNSATSYHEGPLFNWEGGFSHLMGRKLKITDTQGKACTNCSEPLSEDYTFYFEDEPYCEDCFNDRYAYCDNCEEVHVIDRITFNEYGSFCDDCRDKLFKECPECGKDMCKNEGEICEDCNTQRTPI